MLFIDENKYPKIVLEVSNRTDLSLKTWEKKNIEPCGRLVTKINLTRPVRRKQTYNFFWPDKDKNRLRDWQTLAHNFIGDVNKTRKENLNKK